MTVNKRPRSEYLKEAAQLEKKIKAGSLTGKDLKAAKKRLYYCQWKAGAKGERFKHKVDPNQGFLPTFVNQLDMVRIEELVAEKIFNELKSSISTHYKTQKKRRGA